MKAKIISKLETSDHDGYCSGGECDYESNIIETITDVPIQYKSHPKGKLSNLDEYDWEKILPIPKLNLNGSCYCDISQKSKLFGLGVHDYKYTIMSVEFFDENSDEENKKFIKKLDMKKIYRD